MFHTYCREDVRDELDCTPDGTFLVRNSHKTGNYNLAVRKNRSTEFFRINASSNGKYSFTDVSVSPPVLVEFSSVPAIVEYFKQVPLTRFHSGLNVTLVHPHSRFMVRLRGLAVLSFCKHFGSKKAVLHCS